MSKSLQGTGVSGGRHTGSVRLVRSKKDAEALDKSHVAVVLSPEREHLHLLKRAGSIITESGGLLGHVAKVAREGNIPFVSGIPKATELLQHDESVSVDGASGTVMSI